MVYSDRLSKLSLSSRRCFAGLAFLTRPALSFVDTELERDISLRSSVSIASSVNDSTFVSGICVPGVQSPLLSSLPNMRSRALAYAASLSSRDNLQQISKR